MKVKELINLLYNLNQEAEIEIDRHEGIVFKPLYLVEVVTIKERENPYEKSSPIIKDSLGLEKEFRVAEYSAFNIERLKNDGEVSVGLLSEKPVRYKISGSFKG